MLPCSHSNIHNQLNYNLHYSLLIVIITILFLECKKTLIGCTATVVPILQSTDSILLIITLAVYNYDTDSRKTAISHDYDIVVRFLNILM